MNDTFSRKHKNEPKKVHIMWMIPAFFSCKEICLSFMTECLGLQESTANFYNKVTSLKLKKAMENFPNLNRISCSNKSEMVICNNLKIH
jgi:hypothetical protein